MDPFQPHDAVNSFRETVQVGRNGNSYHDVTIYYFNRGRGGKSVKKVSFALSQSKHIQHSLAFIPLLEFRITDGGTKIWEQPDGRDRRLTVQTRNGHTFTITRRYRGGLCFSANFSQSKSKMSKLVQLIQFILSLRLLLKH